MESNGRSVGRMDGWWFEEYFRRFSFWAYHLCKYVWDFKVKFQQIFLYFFFCFFPYKDSVSISSDAFDFPSIVAYSEVVDV